MDGQIELISLACIKCGTPILADPEETAWSCSQCGQGMHLDEKQGLVPLQISFAAGIAPGTRGKPYWVVDGQAAVQREMYSGNQNRDAQEFWSQPRRFFIPAYALPLDALLTTGVNFLTTPPAIQAGSSAPFEPVVLPLEDVRAAAEFIVVAIEAGRKDKLREVNFTLQLSQPALWILH